MPPAPALAPPLADAAGYDAVAARYARLARRYSREPAAALVARAGLRPGARVLDVGTGPGNVALEAARVVGASGRVLGVDVSGGMLAQACAAAEGLAVVSFRGMAAEALALPDGSFDAALSLYAIAHLGDPAAAVREMHRVLRPGGRLVLGQGSRAPLGSVAGLRHHVRRVPLRIARWRGRCLVVPDDLERLLGAEGAGLDQAPHVPPRLLTSLVRAAGFVDVSTTWVGHDAVVDSPEEGWDLATAFSTPARTWLAGAAAEARERVRARFLAACARVQSRGGLIVHPQGARLVMARRGGEGP